MLEEINCKQAKELIAQGNVVIADTRRFQVFEEKHIKNAVYLSLGNLDAFCKKFSPDQTIILYCYVGGRSHKYAAYLTQCGYQKIYSLAGGFEAAEKAGFEIEEMD